MDKHFDEVAQRIRAVLYEPALALVRYYVCEDETCQSWEWAHVHFVFEHREYMLKRGEYPQTIATISAVWNDDDRSIEWETFNTLRDVFELLPDIEKRWVQWCLEHSDPRVSESLTADGKTVQIIVTGEWK